jgi:hypothetical protein
MQTQTIDHTTLSHLADAGMLSSTHAVGSAGGWGIIVKYGATESALAAQRSQNVRVFRKLETLVQYLKSLGIAQFEVDAANFDVGVKTAAKRPDRALALKSAHEAAAYTKWLKSEIQDAIDDPSPMILHEDVMGDMREVIKRARAARA